ncbi:hypothetical protein IE077_000178 [Cardiosporidium cionae]|uniref:Uncharacterized protein n=1 Tax=Cardiosporidium cionae TaxID=476202 RepID=A0ABQ7JCW5_9APIC|nr:hypothetical protein IE077_000178 [Cardiosporidium cionae]|eukprot:KAF8821821.1 hypothetical protein IE077_000178 [Cardiosporidium cionae]
MVPIYATQSFVAYQFPSIALYLDVIRDCYEAYVLHTFLCLLINYLGGEDAIVLHFDAKAQLRHPWPIGRILRPIFCNRQSYFLAWAVHLHLLGVGQNSDERTAALVLQDLLICIELPWLAVAHNFAFSYKDFDIGDLPLQPLLSGLTTALYVDDLLKDAHESFFKPVVSKEFVMQTVEEKTTQRRKDRSDLDQGDFIVHNE